MSAVRPRALLHQGRHPAAGVLLEAPLVPEAEARRRVLAAWRPGDRVHAVEGGLLHRFARPRLQGASEAAGLLLVEEGGLLLGCPLGAGEREALAPGPGALVVARGGEAVARSLGPAIDPAAWLALDLPVVAVEPLGGPPAAPALAPAPPEDLRAMLSIPPSAAEAGTFAVALQRALDRWKADAKAPPAPQAAKRPTTGPGAEGHMTSEGSGIPEGVLVLGVMALLKLLFGGDNPVVTSIPPWALALVTILGVGIVVFAFLVILPSSIRPRATPAVASSSRGPGPAPAPGRFARLLGKGWDRLVIATRVSRLAGLRQGAYLLRLLRQLDDGDLGEALRRAVPLGGGGPDDRLSLRLPGRRSGLEISSGRRPGTLIDVPGGLLEALRQRYRRAFDRLDRLGRHQEAAFVLAELLRSEEEAVAYLERHGRLRQAAVLAEGRGLRQGLVIRQWFLAGDPERAVRLARAHRAFADAVDRLERSRHAAEATVLRLCWADDLAEAGDLAGAVRAALPVPEARPLVERWIELALGAGGAAGPALLGTWVELRPDRFAEARARVLAACQDAGEDGPAHRRAVAQGLVRLSGSPALQALARPVLRALLADEAQGRPGGVTKELSALAGDALLQADQPARAGGHGGAAGPQAFQLTLPAGDRGTRPAHAAAPLPGGRVLVALGEGGVRLLARDGRELARFEAPAHALVVSDLGTRALAVGGRGEVVSVVRLDLEARTSRRLRDLRLQAFATSFDGTTWAVSEGPAVQLLDTLREDLRTLWHVSELAGLPVALERPGPDLLAFAVEAGDGTVEGWSYQGGALRQRTALAFEGGLQRLEVVRFGGCLIDPVTTVARWHAVLQPEEGAPLLAPAGGTKWPPVPLEGAENPIGFAGGERPALALRCADAVEVRWFTPLGAPLGRLRLEGARSAALRTEGDLITVADDLGRVLVIDALRGRLVTDLRV